MNNLPFTQLTMIGSLLAAGSISSSAVTLYAGWDTFTSEPESSSPATHLASSTTATLSGTATGGSWNDWNNGVQGASDDGTFGDLEATVAAASTDPGTGSNQNTNLSLNRSNKPGTLTLSLVNDSALDRIFDGFYFDGGYRFTQSARNWELTFSDAISGTAASGTLAQVSSLKDAPATDRDWGIDLSGLGDNVWEAGSTAVFTLTFTGGDSSASTGGGHETLIDNIGVTATAVPEPSAFALFGLSGLVVLLRRRRA